MTAPDIALDLQIALESWQKIPRLRRRLQQAAGAAIAHLPRKFHFPCAATLLLTGNGKVRQLNRDWRGMDKPTNILSFPQFEPAELPKISRSGDRVELGDMALAYQYIVAEAKNDHKILINHISHLVIHGLLHLFGYDHLLDSEAEAMERLEIRIMESLDLPNPYESICESLRKERRRRR